MIVSHPLEILPCHDCCLCLVKQKPCFKCLGCLEFHETVYDSFSKVSPVADNKYPYGGGDEMPKMWETSEVGKVHR